MEFFGDNSAFGTEMVGLTPDRHVDRPYDNDAPFPLGFKDLLPVRTSRRKKGGYKVVYAFPFAQGEPPADNELARELCDAVEFVNKLLAEARELSEYDFGSIGAVNIGIPEKGYSFTRVEEACDENGEPTVAPVRLRIETSDKPSQPDTLSAVIEYDADGYVMHVLMTEYGEDGDVCRATASVDYYFREVVVMKVVLTPGDGSEPVELYRRHPDGRYAKDKND